MTAGSFVCTPVTPVPLVEPDTPEHLFSTTSMNSIVDVFNDVGSTERVIFITRHAKRGSGTGSTGDLVDEGVSQCETVGAKLTSNANVPLGMAYLGSTDTYRTKHTTWSVAKARGETVPESYLSIDTSLDGDGNPLQASIFNIGTTDWNAIGTWCQDDANWDSIQSVGRKVIDGVVQAVVSANARFAWLTDHDNFIAPLVTYVSNRSIVYSGSSWVNFLSGVAVIVHPNGGYEAYPVDSGYGFNA